MGNQGSDRHTTPGIPLDGLRDDSDGESNSSTAVSRYPNPLTDEQFEALSQSLPDWRRAVGSDQLREVIERARDEFHRVRELAPEDWGKSAERKTAKRQLNQVVKSAESFLNAVSELQPLAELLMTRNPERFIYGQHQDLPGWTRESDRQMPARLIPDAADAVAGIHGLAVLELKKLREWRGSPGRPMEVSEVVLARRLAGLWVYLGGSLSPDNRSGDARQWPYLEFLRAVGRTVAPDFWGEGAARQISDSHREAARSGSE